MKHLPSATRTCRVVLCALALMAYLDGELSDADRDALDARIAAGFATIATKRIVTFHDAFAYFARAYGIEIVGVAVASPGQDPSAREIAALITASGSALVEVTTRVVNVEAFAAEWSACSTSSRRTITCTTATA